MAASYDHLVKSTTGGMNINLEFVAADNPTASFEQSIETAAQILANSTHDTMTVNISVGYGEVGGTILTGGEAEADPLYTQNIAYSQVRNFLQYVEAPGAAYLPAGSSIQCYDGSFLQSYSTIEVSASELRLMGKLSLTSSVVDGEAGFATDISPTEEVGVALHELTHAMGRVPDSGYGTPNIFDLCRFDSYYGLRLVGYHNPVAPPAYFSFNGGATKLADYGQNSDPSDFLNNSLTTNDAFNEYYTTTTNQYLSALDLVQLKALGFTGVQGLTWNTTTGYFADSYNWDLGFVPGTWDKVNITGMIAIGGGGYSGETATSLASETINTLTIGTSDELGIAAGNFVVSNGLASSGTITVASGSALFVGGAISGSGVLYDNGGLIQLDSTDANTINFNSSNGGTVALEGSGSYSISSAFGGGNSVILASSHAMSVQATGTFHFHDQGSANDYIGVSGNLNVLQNVGSAADQFYVTGDQNQLFGGTAGGWLGLNGSNNALVGNSGTYWIGATGNSNTMVAGSGSTTLFANGHDNYLYAGSNQDWLGVSGNQNQLYGGAGADWMGATGAHDAISAGTGNSTLFADGNYDTLSGGGGGNDWIGVTGNYNHLYGGSGNDYIAATGNYNVLNPYGAGTDTLVAAAGGHSHDQFVFHPGDGKVTVDNFTPSSGDVIDIAGWGLSDVGHLSAYTSVSGGNTVIHLGGSELTIAGVTSSPQSSWFNFHA